MNLKKIYKKIPTVEGCEKGCTDCCGPVTCSAEEFASIPDIPEKLAPACDENGERAFACRFKTDTGCLVYEHRPLICRLFGAMDGLACSHGARAERPLNARAAQRLIHKVGKEGLVIL